MPRSNASRGPSIIVPEDELAPNTEAFETIGIDKTKTAPLGLPATTRIILDETDNMPPTGQMFQINGRAFLIVPGVPVDVPDVVIEVLDNAVHSVPTRNAALQVTGYRDRHRFPYRVLRRRQAA